MKAMLAVSRAIDGVSTFVGKATAWLILVAVLISAGNAVIRKAFDISSNAWLELQWYLYGTVFLLAASYTLLKNEHVRIDFVNNMLSKRARDWVDLLGFIFFLLPFTTMMVWLSGPWFVRSFLSGEFSANAGGLILWPAKIMIVLGFSLLTAQGISEIIKRWAVIRGVIDDPRDEQKMTVMDIETAPNLHVGREDAK